MKDLNTVFIEGRIVRDAELRYTDGGLAVMNYSIASNDRGKENGEWVDKPYFFDAVILGKLAEAIAPRMKKGAHVFISGELRQNRWESEGQKRSKVEIYTADIKIV